MNSSPLKFSFGELPIGLGCMSLPEAYDKAPLILSRALDLGIQFFDTADLYQNGLNEGNLGKFFQGNRDQIKLASKVGNQLNPDGKSWSWNPSKAYILKAAEDSLRRLRTDYLDLYQLHGGTLEDPWEETLEAFEILKTQGKILAFGISSIRPNVIRKVMSMNPPATIMMQYSPLDRRPEEEVFPLLEKTPTRVLVRGGMTKGILLDKPLSPFLDLSTEKVAEIKNEIHSSDFSPEAVLIKYSLDEKAVGMMVLGASRPEQLEKNLRALEESKSIPDDYILQLKQKFSPNKYQDHR
ncbi:aldo/keto reductase [Algoriphagus mannitolivorans]|uniref:aldo/keto reductase n=1 Tax=Algoriphagus mannitolivorans TaxID=226504 RepID=UPI00040A0206|nr:aldo/keto reductase [Algoriphagus mannitolivorans]